MRILIGLALLSFCASGQTAAFSVASVRPSAQPVGPDYNNQISLAPDAITARNVTLKRLVMEAYQLLPHQVLGPAWLNDREYEVVAKADAPVTRDQMRRMLQTLLAERFGLAFHKEHRELRVYVLTQARGGVRTRTGQTGRGWEHFDGEMQEFADLLGVRLTIAGQSNPDPTKPMFAAGPPVPVIDRTGLVGTYDFDIQATPEAGTDIVAFWQHALEDQLGLRLENRREHVEVLVIDRAESVPTTN